jgi:hypothetical protein
MKKVFKWIYTNLNIRRNSKMAGEKQEINQVDGAKATTIAREFLEQNFGNVGMLYYRVEKLERNGAETQFYVTCSILSAFGSKERLYYRFKVNISDGNILEVWRSKPTKEDEAEITLTKIKIKEE